MNKIQLHFFPSNFIVVQVQFSAFPLAPQPTPQPSPPPSHFHSPPRSIIVHVSFIIAPTNPLPFPPEIPSLLLSSHCQPFLNLSIFGYILLVCFVD